MMSQGERLAVLLHLVAAAATGIVYAFLRPPAPPRVAGKHGPIALLGRWAYWVLRPVLDAARAVRLSPNGMTAIGTALSLGAGAAAAAGGFGWAGLLLVWGSACDLLDGELARSTGTQTKAGAFLDSNLDRISDIALFAGLAAAFFPDGPGVLWAVAAMASSLMVSYARARGEGLGVSCPAFGLERPHRVVPFMFALLATPFLSAHTTLLLLEWLCALVAIGASATALGRMVVIHQSLRRAGEGAQAGSAGPSAPTR
jgi:CDP-diacylglycerol--glycerol-3-phosphate 3-phosphatidyltransferase